MADEQEPIAEVEAETPIETAAETEQPVNLDDLPETEEASDSTEEGGDVTAETDDDLEEFEWNGQKVKGPKGMKDGVLMHADYTRKTQEVAATRKELEDRAQAIEQQSKASEEELNLRAQLIGFKRDLDQYEAVNWDQLEADDPMGAQQHWRRYQTMKEQAGRAYSELNQRTNQRTQQAQQETAKRLEETRKFAETQIKGWTPEVDAKVTEFATRTLGFDRDTLLGAYNPQVYHALYLAHLGHQILTKPAAATTVQKPAVAPLKVVAAKANPPAKTSLADMSMDEYVKARKAGRG